MSRLNTLKSNVTVKYIFFTTKTGGGILLIIVLVLLVVFLIHRRQSSVSERYSFVGPWRGDKGKPRRPPGSWTWSKEISKIFEWQKSVDSLEKGANENN